MMDGWIDRFVINRLYRTLNKREEVKVKLFVLELPDYESYI